MAKTTVDTGLGASRNPTHSRKMSGYANSIDYLNLAIRFWMLELIRAFNLQIGSRWVMLNFR